MQKGENVMKIVKNKKKGSQIKDEDLEKVGGGFERNRATGPLACFFEDEFKIDEQEAAKIGGGTEAGTYSRTDLAKKLCLGNIPGSL